MTISTIISKIDDFPPLPAVVSRLFELTADSNISLDTLIKIISMDPSFIAVILKLANSAFYGYSMKVNSLAQAIKLLGFTEIRNLVMVKAVFNSFKNLRESDRFSIKEFWKHSYLCGLSAKIIAADLGEDVGEFFTAGLIHDIGKLIFYIEFQEDFFRIIESTGDSLYGSFQEEARVLGITHDKVGMMLFKKWMFPENLLSAAGFHHQPWETRDCNLFPVVIHVADILAYSSEISDGETLGPDISKTLINPEITGIFETLGVPFNETVLEKYSAELSVQKKNQDDAILKVLFS